MHTISILQRNATYMTSARFLTESENNQQEMTGILYASKKERIVCITASERERTFSNTFFLFYYTYFISLHFLGERHNVKSSTITHVAIKVSLLFRSD